MPPKRTVRPRAEELFYRLMAKNAQTTDGLTCQLTPGDGQQVLLGLLYRVKSESPFFLILNEPR